MKTIVVNLLGAAGSGKSTLAAEIFYKLKRKGVNCEYVTEYAKGVVYEENFKRLEDQLLILANQYHSINILKDKVNVVITDSPLLVSIFYNKKFTKNPLPEKLMQDLVMHCYSTSDNLNYFIKRNHEYRQEGRYQDEARARAEENEMIEMIKGLNVDCSYLLSTDNCADIIIKDVEARLNFVKDLKKNQNEIERKFLLKEMPNGRLLIKNEIEQAYIHVGEHERRVRSVDGNRFFYTEKIGEGIIRHEYEKEILKSEYLKLYKLAQGRVIKKTRYYYPLSKKLISEIDVYKDKHQGLRTVEVEFPDLEIANSFVPPKWFGREITNDKKFKNSSLIEEKVID